MMIKVPAIHTYYLKPWIYTNVEQSILWDLVKSKSRMHLNKFKTERTPHTLPLPVCLGLLVQHNSSHGCGGEGVGGCLWKTPHQVYITKEAASMALHKEDQSKEVEEE